MEASFPGKRKGKCLPCASSSDFCKEQKDFMGRKIKIPDIKGSSQDVKVC